MSYNLPLLKTALNLIDLHPEQHVQGQWRCGTGQCMAGWIGIASGAQWAVDDDEYQALLKKFEAYDAAVQTLRGELPYDYDTFLESKRSYFKEHPEMELTDEEFKIMGRGQYVIHPKTGRELHVSDYAEEQIGGTPELSKGHNVYVGDLFEAGNTREDLHKYVALIEAGELQSWDCSIEEGEEEDEE